MLYCVYPPRGDMEMIFMEEHRHTHTKAALHRMARAIGHMNAVKTMIESGRDCAEILIQLSAVRAEIAGVSKVILKDHIDYCVVDAVQSGDEERIRRLKDAVDRLL